MRLLALIISFLFSSFAVADVAKDVDILKVQTLLNSLCYNAGPIDGIWGKKTENAANSFFNKIGFSFDDSFDRNDFLILQEHSSKNEFSNCKINNGNSSVVPSTIGFSYEYKERNYDVYNPDRGFYRDLGNSNLRKPLGTGDLNPRYHNFQRLNENIPKQKVIKNANCEEFCFGTMNVSQPLRFEWMRIDDYFDKPIDPSYLDRLQKYLNDARNKGYKLILRWNYSLPNAPDDRYHKLYLENKWVDYRSPPIDLIITHIKQLSKIVNQNKDIIFAVQAGMLGPWGEWHSDQYGSWKKWKPARHDVLKAWLDNTDSDVVIQVRYPQDYFRKEMQTLSGYERVGIHHDCPNYAKDNIEFYKYRRALKKVPLITGEMCTGKALTSYSCSEMVKYFEDFNFSALRVGYPDDIFVRWHKQGCLSEIRDRLGYRFVLLNSNFDGSKLTIELQNKGFARTHKSRKVSIKLGNKIYSTGHDAINWEPNKISTLVIDLEKIGVSINNQKSLELLIEGGVRFLNTTGNKVYLQ